MDAKAELSEVLRHEFAGMRIIAVSNREPYIHRHGVDGIECIQPASGLATALDPILRATSGTWIAHGSGSADRDAVDSRNRVSVPPGRPEYTLRRVWIDRETEQRYYYGLSNEGLWPLCHIAFQRPTFRLCDWEAYRRANQIFAEAVLDEAGGEPAVVFIQDYHFALLPRILRDRNPRLTIAHFWHIPWPNREVFRVFPWSEELLDGLLGNDVLGFHLQYHCTNFLDTVDRGLEAKVDNEHSTVYRNCRATRVRPFPISIDFARHVQQASDPATSVRMKQWNRELGLGCGVRVGIGIDRADYTKGIPERLRAVDRLMESCPEYRGRMVFLQVAVPSRTSIPEYLRLNQELQQLAQAINAKWGSAEWNPIRLLARHLPQEDLMALHRLADFCLVTSLHDGMNLVAKEFVASRVDEDGVLILSSFTGAARELQTALLVNPFSADQIAAALREALQMPRDERTSRMRSLRRVVEANNIYHWAGRILRCVAESAARPCLKVRAAATLSGMVI